MVAVAMIVPSLIDLSVGNPDWQSFLLSSGFTLFVSGMMILTTRTEASALNMRQAFVMTTLVWICLPAFAALIQMPSLKPCQV